MNPKTQKKTKLGLRHRFNLFLLQHMQACIFSLGQYIKYAISNILTTAVIGISLALPSCFYLLLDNARLVSSNWDSSLQITLFLQDDMTTEQAAEFAKSLTARQSIDETVIINRTEALAEYKRLSGFATALNALDENPLPNVILVKPQLHNMSEPETEALAKELETLDQVDSAQYDSLWIKRLLALLDIINRIVIVMSTLLAIAVLLIIGNTIRLSIYNRRSEIEIIKLFGGTDNFIQRPFLYSGLWYGLFGSIIAWLLIIVAMQMLYNPVRKVAYLYASDFQLIGADLSSLLILLAIGVTLGLFGSWISVKRHLKSIEPV